VVLFEFEEEVEGFDVCDPLPSEAASQRGTNSGALTQFSGILNDELCAFDDADGDGDEDSVLESAFSLDLGWVFGD